MLRQTGHLSVPLYGYIDEFLVFDCGTESHLSADAIRSQSTEHTADDGWIHLEALFCLMADAGLATRKMGGTRRPTRFPHLKRVCAKRSERISLPHSFHIHPS